MTSSTRGRSARSSGCTAAPTSSGSPQAGADLRTLTMPALVLWGQRDPWIAAQFGEAYAHALPNATLETRARRRATGRGSTTRA